MFEDAPSNRPQRSARAPLYPGHLRIVSNLEKSLFMPKHDGSLSCMVTDLFYTEQSNLPAIVHVGTLMLESFDTLLSSLDPENSDDLMSDEDALPVQAKGKSLSARTQVMKKPSLSGRAKKPVTIEYRKNLNFKNKLCNDFSFEANSYFHVMHHLLSMYFWSWILFVPAIKDADQIMKAYQNLRDAKQF